MELYIKLDFKKKKEIRLFKKKNSDASSLIIMLWSD